MGIAAAVGAMAFFGMSAQDNYQLAANAQAELLTGLRSAQTMADSGTGGQAIVTAVFPASGHSYTVAGRTVSLPGSVTVANSLGQAVTACFVNANVAFYDATYHCGGCGQGSGFGFVCRADNTAAAPAGGLVLTVSAGTVSRKVTLEGLGLYVSRVYAD